MDIFAVLCPDGCLGYGDMQQCRNERWVPIATYQEADKTTALCFTDSEIAKKFGRRNYPKNLAKGIIALSKGELQWMKSKGWQIQILSFPNLFKDREGFGYEILEFQSDPEFFMRKDKT